jgi:hypothetical protein
MRTLVDGYMCRDDMFAYFRFDFSDGSPRVQLSKEFREVLAYSMFLYTNHNRDEIHVNVNFSRTLFGGPAASTDLGIWNPLTKARTGLGNKKISYMIGDATMEISVPLDAVRQYIGGAPAEAMLAAANAERTGNWLSHNGMDPRIVDFGF